ncbi:hypothetical protein U1Q18_007445, partial [Sarracenia purpurea var. burkii]
IRRHSKKSEIADFPKVVAELQMARGEIKLLKKRLESETEHNKEQSLNLQQDTVLILQHCSNKLYLTVTMSSIFKIIHTHSVASVIALVLTSSGCTMNSSQ